MGFLLSWDEALKVIDHKKASTPSRMHYLVLLLVWYIHYSFLYIFWFNSSSYVDYLWWKKKKKRKKVDHLIALSLGDILVKLTCRTTITFNQGSLGPTNGLILLQTLPRCLPHIGRWWKPLDFANPSFLWIPRCKQTIMPRKRLSEIMLFHVLSRPPREVFQDQYKTMG